MTIALIIVLIVYLGIATLIAINSVFELPDRPFRTLDASVIAFVAIGWPAVACVLLALLVVRRLISRLTVASTVP